MSWSQPVGASGAGSAGKSLDISSSSLSALAGEGTYWDSRRIWGWEVSARGAGVGVWSSGFGGPGFGVWGLGIWSPGFGGLGSGFWGGSSAVFGMWGLGWNARY